MVENCAFEDKKRINRMPGQDAFLAHDCSVESKLGVMLYENFRHEKIIHLQETVCQQSEKI